jgi:DNA-binding response OmpR family regulator
VKSDLLVAEGDIELCRIFDRFLTKQGYQVATAVDGLDCVAKLRRAAPAVLVLDQQLCWGGGDGVIAWLREESVVFDVPVILTATAGGGADGAHRLEAPVVKYLPKPFALMELLESVRNALARTKRAQRSDHVQLGRSEYFIG